MNRLRDSACLTIVLLALAGCSHPPGTTSAGVAPAGQPDVATGSGPAAAAMPTPAAAGKWPAGTAPADVFLAQLQPLCGKAFAGRVVVDTPASADNAFAGKALVMHVRECAPGAIRIPFHVGDDRSRTWVITRTAAGLRLKHDHRHADGSEDEVTQYGGDTATPGSAQRQEFPVDAESIALFQRNGPSPSVTNTWAFEHVPGRSLTYELARPGGRLFQVEFDLRTPVAAPPPPWGSR